MEWCTNLIKMPDYTEIQNFEILNLSGCFYLSHIQSIGVFKRLKELKLIKCESVANLPFDMTGLESLDALDLGGCAKLEQIPKIGCTLRSILSLDGCISLKKLPDLSGLEFLHKFDASDTAITNFPSPSLLPKKWREFRISGCSDRQAGKFLWFNMSTLSFNNGFDWATKTNGRIYHGGSVIGRGIFDFIMTGASLETSSRVVQQTTTSFGSLKRLNMEWCTNLIKMPDYTEIQNFEILNLSGCFYLSHIQSIGVFKRLKELKLIKCESVANLPFDMTGLESLDALDLGGCAKLEQIPKIGCTLRSILSLDGCIRLKKLPDLSGLEFLHKFDASDTAITNFPSPSLLPKKWREFRISGCSDRQAGKFLWFNMSTLSFNNGFDWATKTNGRIYHGGSVIECERNFLEENSSRCSEWFNNTTTTAVDIIDYEFIPRMNHPKLKGCSLFFVFEYHGPVIHSQFQTKPPFQPQLFAHDRYLPFGTRTPLMPFACIFERDEGIPSEPLFLWAPVILGIGPIEFWAFVPATRFLEFLRWRTCSSCIGASVVPLKKHRFFDNYYFPSKETKVEISLKEWEDPHGTCWDVIDGDLWKDPFVDVKDCRVRLVYEDDVSQFYSTVAPHALHSKYYEHPCYHPSRNG
ncbi:Protein SUPPRESSOR OF npr1-1, CONSTITUTIVE 1 [Morella rubra]|uniref:Protein SUPPRESSOR OF npr1-1, CONSTITUTIVE 1 n=1 Tax=Morella rubra TaxID=262757 RepID=A0A6A1UH40_9ROSI|nr:Protein SUPPRESSOR OF npr1-1, CONSTITUTIVE 1 [Morella rubra]KAB1199771.1 Protein SUPPRESSOR OF npr1-1, CONSTITUTIVE 1 [Morella rubra]